MFSLSCPFVVMPGSRSGWFLRPAVAGPVDRDSAFCSGASGKASIAATSTAPFLLQVQYCDEFRNRGKK